MNITVILPVSRAKYLNRVLESLNNQTHKPQNLLVVFDGPDNEFVEVRNKILEQNFEQKLCVKSNNVNQAHNIMDRRRNIAVIHNQFRGLLGETDWVFSIEDDGIIPKNALANLLKIAKSHKNAGMVSGVELGRWGIPYVGAWRVDNPENPKIVASVQNKTGENLVEEIDACGLYCALIRADYYKQHSFSSYNGLGPDVNLGIFLRQKGLMNYIDWTVHVTHLTSMDSVEVEIFATDYSVPVKMSHLFDDIWEISR